MSDTTVRELKLEEMPQAGALLGRAMRDNPLYVRVAGSDPARRETVFGSIFGVLLATLHAKGTVLGAFQDGKLAGVCALVPPGRGEPTGGEKLRLTSAVLAHVSFGGKFNALGWLGAWTNPDPQKQSHWHLGPVGVERELQGQGIDRALIEAACGRVDAQNGAAYLETDREANLPFYESFTFKAAAETKLIGVPNWSMLRPARTNAARWSPPPAAGRFVVLPRPERSKPPGPASPDP